MAEFVEKRCEDMIPELEQMEKIKLFDKNEIRGIAKKLKEFEYKVQRHTKCKEDYLRYIQYEMDLLKLIKQRRDKYGITHKTSDIDHAVVNKINHLYKEALCKFQDDIRFWIAYIKFCKHMHSQGGVSRMISKMLQVHQDNPKCWHIAAKWEMEENKNRESARQILLRGLHFHPNSQLLYIDSFRLELDGTLSNDENNENQIQSTSSGIVHNDEMLSPLKRAYIVYKEASKKVKNIKFIIELLNITKEYKAEKLQKKIVSDMIQHYAHEPLMWDTMARRELEGLVQPSVTGETVTKVNSPEESSLRDRITSCNQVYQTAVKKIKTEEMWSLYIECLMEINHDTGSLPNLKKKLLKSTLAQAHEAKKLKEKYYLHWVDVLNNDQKDENAQKKVEEILSSATEIIPDSLSLWHLRLRHYLITEQDEEANTVFKNATRVLGEKSLPLWRMKLLHTQARDPAKTEEIFQAGIKEPPKIADDMKPGYVEWLVLTKDIRLARKVYDSLCLQQPYSLPLHKKMADLEMIQPDIILKFARRPFELAIAQFGKIDFKIWINYIVFEMRHGDPKKVGDIYKRAIKTLDASLTETFTSHYTLTKANPNLLR